MQFSTAILALASAVAVSADAIFRVSDFTASCAADSSQCSYDFTVLRLGTMETTGVTCSKTATSSGTLPAVTDGTCTDSARTWTVAKAADGSLTLTVSQPVSVASDESGSYAIPASDIASTGSQQSYTGPASFDLSS